MEEYLLRIQFKGYYVWSQKQETLQKYTLLIDLDRHYAMLQYCNPQQY